MPNTKKKAKWYVYAIMYLFYIGALALGFFIFLFGRNVYLAASSPIAARGFTQRWTVAAADKFAVIGFAIVYIAFAIGIERYFYVGVSQGKIVSRLSRVLGGEVLAIFVLDLVFSILVGFANRGNVSIFLLIVEFVVGAAAVALSYLVKPKSKINSRNT